MSRKWLTIFCVMLGLTLSGTLLAQQGTESARWNLDPASTQLVPTGQQTSIPAPTQAVTYVPRTEPRIVYGPRELYVIEPNVRPHPNTTHTQSEVIITRHPSNQNILFASSNTVRISPIAIGEGVYVTTNGGTSWFGGDSLLFGSGHSGDPGPIVDKDGRFIMTHIGTGGMGTNWSTDNGLTWSPNIIVPGGSSVDKNLASTDDAPASPFYGRSYIVYTNFAGAFVNRIVGSFTTNGGVTWSTSTVISPPTSAGHHHQGCDVRVGPNGEVYVVWANCTTNGQNSTEDSLGFAMSTDGGVTWPVATNRAIDMNGIRAASYFNSIRVSGFPRIDVDRSGGGRNGWIYVTAAEKTPLLPARDQGDITCMRSTDGGTTWTKVLVNQDPTAGPRQYMSAIRVDEAGGVNIVYYDQRNTSVDSAEVWMSRSLDGGITWTDVQVSDARFRPTPISGLATGYQGDYIGITSGGGKVWPNWMDNRLGWYQSWVSGIATTENFGWVKGTVTNVSGGAALSGVAIDFTNPIQQLPATSDPTGFYKTGARVDTPGTTRNVTLRGRKFGFRDTLINVTITRNDTLTRNFAMTRIAAATLVVTPDSVDIGNVEIGRTDSAKSILVKNFGATTLNVTNITFTGNPGFSVNRSSFSLVTDDTIRIKVRFAAVAPGGVRTGRLNFVCNDPAAPGVGLRAVSAGVAHFVVVPDTFAFTRNPTVDTTRTTFRIRNTGTDTLRYQINETSTSPLADAAAIRRSTTQQTQNALPKGAIDPTLGETDSSGGPDAFGYRWIDSDSPGGPPFNWVEISSVGTPVTTWTGSTDDGSFSTTLPWSFPFYGTGYTNFFFTTNGWLGFNAPSTEYTNAAIPTTAVPNNAIYAWWDDLQAVGTSGDRTVYYYNDVANSRYVVQWNNVNHLSAAADTFKFQAVLNSNGEILLQYLRMVSPTNLTTATIGIENADGTVGLQTIFNALYIHNNLAIRFSSDFLTWMSTDRTSGTIAPGDSQAVQLRIHPFGSPAGNYYGVQRVTGNTPDVGRVRVGLRVITGVGENPSQLPTEFAISQNYPNPFNPTTRIKYNLPVQATVVLKIYNLLGQEVATLANAPQAAGYYEATWDGRNNFGTNVSSGVYFYRFEATGNSGQKFANLKKMLFLK